MRRRTPSQAPPVAGDLVRRPRRTEARPLVDLSDFHPAELSDFGPALTTADKIRLKSIGAIHRREFVPRDP
jgi:hypothetical protein